jgi:hypothetical protein
VSRHPYFKDGKIVTPTGSWHIGVNAKTEKKEAALKFDDWKCGFKPVGCLDRKIRPGRSER